MAATEGKRATVPCSTHEEDRCFEQERFGSRGKIPLLEICNILSRRTKHLPQFLCREKCREAICSAPQLLSGLCRTQFSTLSRKLQKAPLVLKLAISKLHPQIVDILHPVCTSRSYITCAQDWVAVVEFSIGKAGVYFLKCLHQWQLNPLEMYLHREQRIFLTLLIYSLWSSFYSEGGMCTVTFLMLWHPPVEVNWNASPL